MKGIFNKDPFFILSKFLFALNNIKFIFEVQIPLILSREVEKEI